MASVFAKISDVAVLLVGKNVDKEKLNRDGEGIPYIVGASSMEGGRLKCVSYCQDTAGKTISHKNDVLISTIGTLGKLAVNDIGDCVLSKHVCAVRFVPSIIPEYGLLCLEASIALAIAEYEAAMDDAKTGFARKLDISVIGDLPLCIISIDKQQETAERMVALAEGFSIKTPPKAEPLNIPDFNNLHELEAWIKRDSQRIYDQHKKTLRKLHDFIQTLDVAMPEFEQFSLEDARGD